MITTIAGWATKLRLIYEWLLQAFGKEHFCQNLSFLSMNLSPSCIACYGLIRDGLIYTDLKFLFLAGEKPSSSPTNDRIIYHISRFDLARKYSRPREFCYDIQLPGRCHTNRRTNTKCKQTVRLQHKACVKALLAYANLNKSRIVKRVEAANTILTPTYCMVRKNADQLIKQKEPTGKLPKRTDSAPLNQSIYE